MAVLNTYINKDIVIVEGWKIKIFLYVIGIKWYMVEQIQKRNKNKRDIDMKEQPYYKTRLK